MFSAFRDTSMNSFCPNGLPYRKSSGEFMRCYENDFDACPDSYFCNSSPSLLKNDLSEGYCCPKTAEMEPPPVGCPWNTRPMIGQDQRLITCTPGSAITCPGHGFCHMDSMQNRYICCGKDVGEWLWIEFKMYILFIKYPSIGKGCPRGSKPLEDRGEIVICLPGNINKMCPDVATCHRSYLTDHYQCCIPDNGKNLNFVRCLHAICMHFQDVLQDERLHFLTTK